VLCANTRILEAGAALRTQDIGLLAALGYRDVSVFPRPSVAILVTGDEVKPPGAPLRPGQIYESNGAMLSALAQQAGAQPIRLGHARDALPPLMTKIRKGLDFDILVISGGVSVGDKDFVRLAARRCGIRAVFWRVNMKPGMPLFFGVHRRTLVFGLPGNPVSVLVTFEEFVKPTLHRLMGRAWQDGYATPARLAQGLTLSTTRRTHFVRVRSVSRNGRMVVEPLNGQGSHHLLSVTQADGWIRVASTEGPWRAGARVFVKREAARW
jgi:molybdopterin molybdotransferase